MPGAALTTLNAGVVNGLLLPVYRSGNVLGSAFFADLGLNYTIHDPAHRGLAEAAAPNSARNTPWATPAQQVPPPSLALPSGDRETSRTTIMGARTTVNLLTIRDADRENVKPTKVVDSNTGPITIRCLLAIVTTEGTRIGVGALVLALWRSWFCVLWWLQWSGSSTAPCGRSSWSRSRHAKPAPTQRRRPWTSLSSFTC